MSSGSADEQIARAKEILRGFPADALTAADAYFRAPSAATLDALVFALLAYYLPPTEENTTTPLRNRGDATQLIADLRFDSLAMVELNYVLQGLLNVKLTDDDLRQLRTLGDLRAQVRRHAALT